MKPPAQPAPPVTLIQIDPLAMGLSGTSSRRVSVYTSLEGENPGGSIKDRMVLGELNELIANGKLRPGSWIAEISSGSTARSLAYYCASLGIRCALFVPRTLSEPELHRLQECGAEVHPVEVEGAYERFQNFCHDRAIAPFNQLFDASKRRHYHAFGRTVQTLIGRVDWLIGGVGTGHALSGTGSGMPIGPLLISAEPAEGVVNGIRNIDLERHGPEDPCVAAWFNRRVVVEKQDYYLLPSISTGRGSLAFSDSFRVVLGAFKKLAERGLDSGRPATVFLLGAQNRLALAG